MCGWEPGEFFKNVTYMTLPEQGCRLYNYNYCFRRPLTPDSVHIFTLHALYVIYLCSHTNLMPPIFSISIPKQKLILWHIRGHDMKTCGDTSVCYMFHNNNLTDLIYTHNELVSFSIMLESHQVAHKN